MVAAIKLSVAMIEEVVEEESEEEEVVEA